jgi:hypothetical protein
MRACLRRASAGGDRGDVAALRQGHHAEAGVPQPGYQGKDQSDAVMLAEANKLGFP